MIVINNALNEVIIPQSHFYLSVCLSIINERMLTLTFFSPLGKGDNTCFSSNAFGFRGRKTG